MYLGSWKIDDVLTFTCNTHTPATGAVTDADTVPTYRVYEDETGTPILTGSTAKLDDAGTTGYYSEQITLSAANGLEKGKTYTIRVSATVGGVTGAMSHTFQIEAEVDANIVSDSTLQSNVADIHTDTGTTIPGTITTMQGNVTDVLTDTGTTIPGTITTMQGNVTDILTDTGTTIPATITTMQGDVDNILVDTGTTIPGTITTMQGNVTDILTDTGTTLPASIAGLNDITVAEIKAGIADGTYDLEEMLRLIFSSCCAKVSGGGTTTITFRDGPDTKDRITTTVDTNGNRTGTTLDGT